jgi:hypothetical protein
VTSRSLLNSAAIDDVAKVEAAAADDVLDGVGGPRRIRTAAHAFPLQSARDLVAGHARHIAPDATYHDSFVCDDLQGPRLAHLAVLVADGPITERVVAQVAAGLEGGAGHVRHALGVIVSLELGRQCELPEEEASLGAAP